MFVCQASDGENSMAVGTAVRLLTSDGGILDPDDYVSDVVDDREQVNVETIHSGGVVVSNAAYSPRGHEFDTRCDPLVQ